MKPDVHSTKPSDRFQADSASFISGEYKESVPDKKRGTATLTRERLEMFRKANPCPARSLKCRAPVSGKLHIDNSDDKGNKKVGKLDVNRRKKPKIQAKSTLKVCAVSEFGFDYRG